MITTLKQTIAVDDVADIAVTASVLDPETGLWEREIRVKAGPEEGEEVFVLRLRNAIKARIDITAPEQEF